MLISDFFFIFPSFTTVISTFLSLLLFKKKKKILSLLHLFCARIISCFTNILLIRLIVICKFFPSILLVYSDHHAFQKQVSTTTILLSSVLIIEPRYWNESLWYLLSFSSLHIPLKLQFIYSVFVWLMLKPLDSKPFCHLSSFAFMPSLNPCTDIVSSAYPANNILCHYICLIKNKLCHLQTTHTKVSLSFFSFFEYELLTCP